MNGILAIGIGLVSSAVAGGRGSVVPGERAPNLESLHWIRGDPVNSFETDRVYVLEFWSTWCGACVESIDALTHLAGRHKADATFIAVHIWPQESALKPLEFLKKRSIAGSPLMDFPVLEDVDGAVAKVWMDATESTGLPTAMIIDRASKLVWFGHARDLERPLKEVVGGTFDSARALAEMNRRIRVGRLARESGAAINAGEFSQGIRLILEALDADPNTVADWIPSTYGHLLATSRSPEIAAGLARTILATEAGKRKEVLAGLAHAILHFQPKELRDLDLALALAETANNMSNSADPHIVSTVAMVRAERGDVPGAIRELELAIQNSPNEDARKVLAKTFEDLRDSGRD